MRFATWILPEHSAYKCSYLPLNHRPSSYLSNINAALHLTTIVFRLALQQHKIITPYLCSIALNSKCKTNLGMRKRGEMGKREKVHPSLITFIGPTTIDSNRVFTLTSIPPCIAKYMIQHPSWWKHPLYGHVFTKFSPPV